MLNSKAAIENHSRLSRILFSIRVAVNETLNKSEFQNCYLGISISESLKIKTPREFQHH